jgi:hypothetical protein
MLGVVCMYYVATPVYNKNYVEYLAAPCPRSNVKS